MLWHQHEPFWSWRDKISYRYLEKKRLKNKQICHARLPTKMYMGSAQSTAYKKKKKEPQMWNQTILNLEL